MEMKIDFENIEQKCVTAVNSQEYLSLIEKFIAVKKVFLVGNGGLHFVANHMATDLSRLVSNKAVYSFESVGFITSTSNDHGFENMFTRWLETVALVEKPEECLIVGLSCSGNSSNVVKALQWGLDNNFSTFMISGQKSLALNSQIEEMSLDCEYFHTVEVMCMMIMYDLIHRLGSHCPSITEEKKRMADSPLRRG